MSSTSFRFLIDFEYCKPININSKFKFINEIWSFTFAIYNATTVCNQEPLCLQFAVSILNLFCFNTSQKFDHLRLQVAMLPLSVIKNHCISNVCQHKVNVGLSFMPNGHICNRYTTRQEVKLSKTNYLLSYQAVFHHDFVHGN